MENAGRPISKPGNLPFVGQDGGLCDAVGKGEDQDRQNGDKGAAQSSRGSEHSTQDSADKDRERQDLTPKADTLRITRQNVRRAGNETDQGEGGSRSAARRQ